MAIMMKTRADWANGEGWNGSLAGSDIGAGVSFLFNEVTGAGKGPPLHVHPYDEIQIVRSGRVRYTVDDEQAEAGPGDIVMIPAGARHKVVSLDGDAVDVISVHLSGAFAADFLE